MKLYIDGGCCGLNQKDISKRSMISVVTDENGKLLVDKSNHGGSNNIAEFIALEDAIDYALRNKKKKVKIITDSTNNLAWFNRDDAQRKAQKAILRLDDPEWYQAIKGRIEQLKKYIEVDLEWIGREDNLAGKYIEESY